MKLVYYIGMGILLGTCLSWGAGFVFAERESLSQGPTQGPAQVVHPQESILFVGDVMLARYVEKFLDEEGSTHPYALLDSLLASATHVVGNFEASIPEEHTSTKPMTFRFSVREEHAAQLKDQHFTLLSLANNHALDHGEEGYIHTAMYFENLGIPVGGHPTRLSLEDVEVLDVSGYRVAIIPLHAVFRTPDQSEYREVLAEVSSTTDMQVVYIHWGEEYQLRHSRAQETLAHDLIDHGADAIVGHHPHVVQDIGRYNGAPIFYSLGNFIFDQYWNDMVRRELAVRLTRVDGENIFEIIPLWSERANPEPLRDIARTEALLELAKRSDPEMAEYIALGTIKVPFLPSVEPVADGDI